MRKMVCRIIRRKGEPLGLAIYPSTTFLNLPREIRDRIYYEALVLSQPITVSSVSLEDPTTTYSEETKQTTVSQAYIIKDRDPILDHVALGLLWCQSTVSSEAAIAFYRYNTFHFDGNEVWNPLYTFLKRIGDTNREFLGSLSANFDSSKYVCQDRYGARITTNNGWLPAFDIVHSSAQLPPPRVECDQPIPPRDPTRPTTRINEFVQPVPGTGYFYHEYVSRPVQYIDPAIQACFRLLGPNGYPLTLKLILEDGAMGRPGLTPPYLAVPNFLESLRQEFAGRVALLWNYVTPSNGIIQQIPSIEENGWEIIEIKEGQIHPNFYWPVTHLILRRTKADQIPPTFCESCNMQYP